MQINHIPSPQPYTSTHPTYNNYHPTYPQNRPNRPTLRLNFQNPGQTHLQNLLPFPKLSISNADLFQHLFNAHLILEIPVHPMQPPFSAWYNLNRTCKYHIEVAGHSIKDCEGFKIAVRKLIACGRLDIEEEKGSNMINNPIPNHERGNPVNALEKDEPLIKKGLSLKTPMIEMFEWLKKVGYNVTAPAATIKEEEKYDEEVSCVIIVGEKDIILKIVGILKLGSRVCSQ